MGADSKFTLGSIKKQKKMAYQSSPKMKQRTITGDGSTGSAIGMGNNSTENTLTSTNFPESNNPPSVIDNPHPSNLIDKYLLEVIIIDHNSKHKIKA